MNRKLRLFRYSTPDRRSQLENQQKMRKVAGCVVLEDSSDIRFRKRSHNTNLFVYYVRHCSEIHLDLFEDREDIQVFE